MNQKVLIQKVTDFVKENLVDAEGGHDWWHIYRVWKLSVRIAQTEKANLFIVELGALFHDIADSKFYNGNEKIGPRKTREFLESIKVEKEIIDHVKKIVENISFKGGKHNQEFKSIELDVVQDADWLDAIGAIGIARVFNYGGFRNRAIHNPKIKPNLNMTKEEYQKTTLSSLNHFYEKLLLLKDRMNTRTGKKMAVHRHNFMEQFLTEFYKEWDGET